VIDDDDNTRRRRRWRSRLNTIVIRDYPVNRIRYTIDIITISFIEAFNDYFYHRVRYNVKMFKNKYSSTAG